MIFVWPTKKDKDRREGPCCCLGDRIDSNHCHASCILLLDDLKKGMNSSYSSYCPGTIHSIVLVHFILFFNSSRCKIATFCPPSMQRRPFLFPSVFILLLCYKASTRWSCAELCSSWSNQIRPDQVFITTLLLYTVKKIKFKNKISINKINFTFISFKSKVDVFENL